MKSFIIILSSILIVFGCQNEPEGKPDLEGDLYYRWLKMGSFYNLPDSFYQNYLNIKDSLGIKELIKRDSITISRFELLEKHNLVKSPFIYLKADSNAIYTVYMTPKQYKPITKFKYQDLIDKKQKIRIKLITEPLSNGLRICKKVVSIEKVEGKTLQKQQKFKIENYR